jgi:hypothetical protein
MFGFLKRKKSAPLTVIELQAIVASAEIDIREKWVRFTQMLHFKDDVPLSNRIEAFAPLARDFIRTRYPIILTGPAGVFWLIIFDAVRQSGTNSVDEINSAIAELRQKFAVAEHT